MESTPVKVSHIAYNKWSPRMKSTFCEAIAKGQGITATCNSMGVSTASLREARKKDQAFDLAFEEAKERMVESIEAAAVYRAVYGTPRPICQKGQRVYERNPVTGDLIFDDNGNPIPVEELVFSDKMAQMLLQAHAPEKYTNRIEFKGNITTGVLRVGPQMTEEEWAAETGA